jgi:hypothetical protein
LQASELRRHNDAAAELLVEEGLAAHQPLTVPSQYAASFGMQRRMLLRKFFAIYFRSPHYSEWGVRGSGQLGDQSGERSPPALASPTPTRLPFLFPTPADFVRLLMTATIAIIYGAPHGCWPALLRGCM